MCQSGCSCEDYWGDCTRIAEGCIYQEEIDKMMEEEVRLEREEEQRER